MNLPRSITLTSIFLVSLVCLYGCEGIDRGYESWVKSTDPDRARLATELEWLNPQPRIQPSNHNFVYCRVRNSSGADINLRHAVQDEIEASGFRLTRNLDEAQYIINADLRYFGESTDKTHDALVGGAVLGGVGGAVIGHQMGDGHAGEGALVGAAAGALLGNIIADRNKMRKISLIVDVRIGERIQGGVVTNRGGQSKSDLGSSNAMGTTGGRESGSSSTGFNESQSVQLSDDFLYHENRVIAWAERLNLAAVEAEPVLTRRLSRAIASALP